jgi:hypothetical protein
MSSTAGDNPILQQMDPKFSSGDPSNLTPTVQRLCWKDEMLIFAALEETLTASLAPHVVDFDGVLPTVERIQFSGWLYLLGRGGPLRQCSRTEEQDLRRESTQNHSEP